MRIGNQINPGFYNVWAYLLRKQNKGTQPQRAMFVSDA